MSSSRANPPLSGGFSLVELLVVVSIISLMAVVSMPTNEGVAVARVAEAAVEVSEALRHARDLSLADGGSYGVELDTVGERIRVLRLDTSGPPLPVYDVLHPLSKRPWDVDFDTFLPARGVDLSASENFLAPCVTPTANVYFSAGEVAKCLVPTSSRLDTATYTLTRGSHVRTVTLDGLTGRVTSP